MKKEAIINVIKIAAKEWEGKQEIGDTEITITIPADVCAEILQFYRQIKDSEQDEYAPQSHVAEWLSSQLMTAFDITAAVINHYSN